MPQFTQHLPGTFSWPELATTDQTSAVAFYRGLFGWDVDDIPMGPDDRYSMFKLRGLEVGAGYTMREDERKMEELKRQPFVAEALKAFPGAEIVAVRQPPDENAGGDVVPMPKPQGAQAAPRKKEAEQ